MKEIKFIAGYYEWHLLVDNKLVWVEGDGTFDTIYENAPYMDYFNGQILDSDLEALVVDDIVDYIRYEALEDYENGNLSTNFDFNQEMFEILNSLTEEEWKQVWVAIHNGYARHYGVTNRRFKYKDLEFEAVGNILGGWYNKTTKVIDWVNCYNNTKYSSYDFYEVAKKNHLSCDVYRIIGDWDNFYMSCGDRFLKIKFDSDFKPCDNYRKWYK